LRAERAVGANRCPSTRRFASDKTGGLVEFHLWPDFTSYSPGARSFLFHFFFFISIFSPDSPFYLRILSPRSTILDIRPANGTNPSETSFYCATALTGDEFGTKTRTVAVSYNYYHELSCTSIGTQQRKMVKMPSFFY
jgi:hypothetical protein